MDLETLALAKAYTDKSRLAYTEQPAFDIEWDGVIGEKYHLYDPVDRMGYVKVSDYLPPVDSLVNTAMSYVTGAGTENEAEIEARALVYDELSDNRITMVISEDNQAFAFVVREAGASVGSDVFEETGVYFLINEPFGLYISKLHINEIVHRLPAEYAPEIPFFDLAEMGLPPIAPDVAGTGECVELRAYDNGNRVPTGVDFTEFEKALKNYSVVRIRLAVVSGSGIGYVTALATPVYMEMSSVTFWQITSVAAVSFTDPTLRVTVLYDPDATVIGDVHYGRVSAQCAVLQHFTM